MKDNFKEKLDYLVDEMGGIDERYINEALSTVSKQRKISSAKLFVLSAAVICALVLSVFVGAAVSGVKFSPKNSSEKAPDSLEQSEQLTSDRLHVEPPVNSEAPSGDILRELVLSLDKNSFETVKYAEGERDFLFDRQVRIIWTFNKEVYYAATVTGEENIKKLEDYFENEESIISTTGQAETFGMWVSFGDGRVLIPYLLYDSGGAVFGNLPDYIPEGYPDDDFANFIFSLIDG